MNSVAARDNDPVLVLGLRKLGIREYSPLGMKEFAMAMAQKHVCRGLVTSVFSDFVAEFLGDLRVPKYV